MLIEEIEGRSVMLSAAASGSGSAFMQITGIQWELNDADGPQTRLIVDRGVREYVDAGYSLPKQPDYAKIAAAMAQNVKQAQASNSDSGEYTNPLMQ